MAQEAQEFTVTAYFSREVNNSLTLNDNQLIRNEGTWTEALAPNDPKDRLFITNFLKDQRERLEKELKEAQEELKACDEIEKFLQGK